jgi:hypothetical protein
MQMYAFLRTGKQVSALILDATFHGCTSQLRSSSSLSDLCDRNPYTSFAVSIFFTVFFAAYYHQFVIDHSHLLHRNAMKNNARSLSA